MYINATITTIPLPIFFCTQAYCMIILVYRRVMYVMLYLYPTMSRMSLLLHEPEAKPRTSVNNNDILRVQWDITCLYPKRLS